MADPDRGHRCGIHESTGGTDMARQRHFDCEYRGQTPQALGSDWLGVS